MESSWSEWNLEAKERKLTSTLRETLDLFFNKNSISQIATRRGFKEESIEKQIIDLITLSYININDILNENIKKEILNSIEKRNSQKLSEIKESVDNEITYFQIKCVIAYENSFAKNIKEKKHFLRGNQK